MYDLFNLMVFICLFTKSSSIQGSQSNSHYWTMEICKFKTLLCEENEGEEYLLHIPC